MENNYLLNMNFLQAACIRADEQQWVKSPADGVSRVHLEREDKESGHTTSFVKFAANSFFPPHQHPQGEEIYVLDGVFSDETGDYPAGTYIRNPPGSFHQPYTKEGCTLFVKLDQFQKDDNKHIVIKPEDQHWQAGIGRLKVLSLHTHNSDQPVLLHPIFLGDVTLHKYLHHELFWIALVCNLKDSCLHPLLASRRQ